MLFWALGRVKETKNQFLDGEPDLTEDGEKSIAPNLRGNHDRNVTQRFAQDAKGAQKILEKGFFFSFLVLRN